MIKYHKPPIVPALEEVRRTNPEWRFFTLEAFPSLTVALRQTCL
jgi:hypothetical protein